MNTAATYDVVVLGAGIQGLSAAYNLALNGITRTLVLDTHQRAGLGSSARSASMLMKSRENVSKIKLSLYSYARFMRFQEEFGEELSFRRTGFLSIVTSTCETRYEKEHALRRQLGVPSERLTVDEVHAVAPGVRTDDAVFGVLGPDDGEIDTQQVVAAFERRGRELGVSYNYGHTAQGLAITRGQSGFRVDTDQGAVSCGFVVNAAGARAREVASWVGCELPIRNCSRSLYYGETTDPSFWHGPMVEDAEIEWYYRPLGGRRVLLGMGTDPDGAVGDEPSAQFLPQVRAAARKRAPGVADFTVTRGSSGIRPLTPDILPIVGPVDGLPQFIHSCGWGGEGIMHSPAGGSLVAYWIHGGVQPPVDPSPFLPDRFSASNPTRKEQE